MKTKQIDSLKEPFEFTDKAVAELFSRLDSDVLNKSILDSENWRGLSNAEKVFRMFSVLLIQSERRIDSTNKMVFRHLEGVAQLESFIKELTNVYEAHIKSISANRDLLLGENIKLREEIHRLINENQKRHEEYVKLVDKVISIHSSENNFNINK